MPIDTSSVDYQIRTKIADLAVEIAEGRSFRRTRPQQRKALRLLYFAQALDYSTYMDAAQIDSIYYCAISTAGIDSYPVAPLITPAPSQTINDGVINFINLGTEYTFNKALEETSGNVINVKYNRGLTVNGSNQLELDVESLELVTPTIVGDLSASAIWNLKKDDDTTTYTLPSGALTNQSITVHNGVKAYVGAKFSYPAPSASQSGPSSISGDFGSTDPGAGAYSATFTNGGSAVLTNDSFSVTLTKPKSGLIVVGDQVEFASGNDSTSDTISVTFADYVYFGYNSDATLTEAQIKALGTIRFGDESETFTGVTAPSGNYTYFCYPSSYGSLSNVILDGASPVLGAFTRLSDVNITNEGGITVAMAVYKSNATAAFSSNTLEFS